MAKLRSNMQINSESLPPTPPYIPTVQSYFKIRIHGELGLTVDQYTVDVEFDCYDDATTRPTPLFTENSHGGIDILYVGINGLKTYLKYGKKQTPYIRTRHHPNQVQNGSPRYTSPRGAGTEIFVPPAVLRAYHQQQPIQTLFITEGEFKAMKASLYGMYCLGAQGIHNIHEKTETGSSILNSEIECFIRVCQVKNLVLLLDNDCLSVHYNPEKDLAKRPFSFYSAVKNFREYTKHLNCDVYFSHLRSDLPHKGLDDLFCALSGQENLIIGDLLNVGQKDGTYRITQNITDKSLKALKAYFHITSHQDFYAAYEEEIGDNKFLYAGHYYQPVDGKAIELVSGEIDQYFRIGDTYYKRIEIPDPTGRPIPEIVTRQKATITDDLGKPALKYIAKYEAQTLVPSHHNYQQVIGNCYNMYHRLTHLPVPGDVSNSLAMVKHIFKDKYEFGLDYLQLLYLKPNQLLPVLLLQSRNRSTGKSTFGQWLIDIFQNNAVKLGNADLENEFNSTYAERLMIVVDETSLSKKVTSEAIKRMSTEQGKIFVNAKGRQQYATFWIGKFIFITNTLSTALYIGKGENRYFVRTIESLPATGDVDMLDKLQAEIPAFLHFLQERTLYYPHQGRMYFDFSVYQTPELTRAIDENKSSLEQEITVYLEEAFDAYTDVDQLYFAPVDLMDELKGRYKYSISQSEVINVLKHEFGLSPTESGRYIYHALRSYQNGVSDYTFKKNGRPYMFSRNLFASKKNPNAV